MALLSPAKAALPEWFYPANLVTDLRLAAIPVILVAVATSRLKWAFWLFVLAALSDGIDGWLARHFKQQSVLGSYLDPLADKLLLTTLFAAMAIVGMMPWALSILVFVRDGCILASAAALFFLTSFRDFRPTWWGKASTTAELLTVGVALLVGAYRSVGAIQVEKLGWVAVTILVVISGIHYAFISAQRYHMQRA